MMEHIRDQYLRQGKTYRRTKIQAEADKIEKKRSVKRKQRVAAPNEELLLIHQLATMLAGVIGTVIVIVGVVFLIFGLGGE